MKKQSTLFWSLGLLLAMGSGYFLGQGQKSPPAVPTSPQLTPARIETTTVESRQVRSQAQAVGNLTTDPDRESRVGSPLAGRVAAIHRSVGDRVLPGDPLAVVTSPEITRLVAGLHHAQLRYQQALASQAQQSQAIRLGDETLRPLEDARSEVITNQTELEVRRSATRLSHQNLERVEGLFKLGVVAARELEVARADHRQAREREQQARAMLDLALQHRTREQRIRTSGAVIGPKLNALATELKLAEEELRHQQVTLSHLGLDAHSPDQGLVLRAPRAGTLIERTATLGQSVNAEQELFRIVDSQVLWLWVFLPNQDLASVAVNSRAQLEVEQASKTALSGRVSYIAPTLDPQTRTAKARIVVDNTAGHLRAGMFVRATFPASSPRSILTLPIESVLVEGTTSVVFRQLNGTFQRTPVEVGAQYDNHFQIVKGLEQGETVARYAPSAAEVAGR